jgi:hypothetical protein
MPEPQGRREYERRVESGPLRIKPPKITSKALLYVQVSVFSWKECNSGSKQRNGYGKSGEYGRPTLRVFSCDGCPYSDLGYVCGNYGGLS